MRRLRAALRAILPLLALSSSALAQRPEEPLVPLVATREVVLDGRLGDPLWKDAPVLDRFTQQAPDEGQPATEPTEIRVVVALGNFAWQSMLRTVRRLGGDVPVPKPRFGHGVEVALQVPAINGSAAARKWTILGCFHPSPLNTQTGKLSEEMLDEVFLRARDLAGLEEPTGT